MCRKTLTKSRAATGYQNHFSVNITKPKSTQIILPNALLAFLNAFTDDDSYNGSVYTTHNNMINRLHVVYGQRLTFKLVNYNR
ncbi:hypothetical protein T08_7487 [Trichinella sp. T8]|nr:hypothetical protein T08_7487 [Trichinella sp. T8]